MIASNVHEVYAKQERSFVSMGMQVSIACFFLYPRLLLRACFYTNTGTYSVLDYSIIIMGAGAFIEPLVVISLLVGGTLVNRETRSLNDVARKFGHKRDDNLESGSSSPKSKDSQDGLLSPIKFLEQSEGWCSR